MDKKFSKPIGLLGDLEKDFFSPNPMPDPKIKRTVTRDPKMMPEHASKILHVLKVNLHAKVKFPSIRILANGQSMAGRNKGS